MSTLKNKNSLRTIEAQIVQKLKNNEPRPKFTDSYKKKKEKKKKSAYYNTVARQSANSCQAQGCNLKSITMRVNK